MAQQGQKNIAVCAPAFSSDCIETLEEINEEIKDSFVEAGGESFTYISCLNDSEKHIDVLTNIIGENLHGWIWSNLRKPTKVHNYNFKTPAEIWKLLDF